MHRSHRLRIAAISLGLGLAGSAWAQDDPTASAPSTTPKPAGLSIESPIRDLLANPAAVDVLNKDMPGLTTYPQLDMIKSMSLKQIAQFPQAHLDEAKLKAIQADLDAATAGGATSGTAAVAPQPPGPATPPGPPQ